MVRSFFQIGVAEERIGRGRGRGGGTNIFLDLRT